MTDVRLENQSNSLWGSAFISYKEKEYAFPYHIPSGEVFNDDPEVVIRLKCMALVGLTPLISIVRSIYSLAVSILTVLSEIYHYLDGQSSSQDALVENAYDSLRALGYGTVMTGCALMGIFAPYQGRLHYGRLERALNRHSDGPHRDKFYLALCFQRLAVLSEEDENGSLVADKLTRYLTRVDAIREAFWGCEIQQLMVELRLRPARRP